MRTHTLVDRASRTRTATMTITGAVMTAIDDALVSLGSRELLSGAEVTDVLLDLRLVAAEEIVAVR
jgi:hypothetical protein